MQIISCGKLLVHLEETHFRAKIAHVKREVSAARRYLGTPPTVARTERGSLRSDNRDPRNAAPLEANRSQHRIR
jgi:hypothetical protein